MDSVLRIDEERKKREEVGKKDDGGEGQRRMKERLKRKSDRHLLTLRINSIT